MAEHPAGRTALVLGTTGQLGRALRQAVEQGWGAGVARHWQWAERTQCDLAQPERLALALRHFQPDILINAAAYTAVDRAESEPDLAWQVNAHSVQVLAQYARERQLPMVHFSTDYVFDGHSDRPYTEIDAPNPQSVYGRSKLAGEQAVQALVEQHLLIRTSWVFARHGGNFIKTMLRLARERTTLQVVADQWGVPTSARSLARQCLQACAQALAAANGAQGAQGAPAWGLYHLTGGGGYTNWHGYACHVLARAAQWGAHLRVPAEQVQAIRTQDYPTPAQRPSNSRLDCQRWVSSFGLGLTDWRTEVDQVLADVLLDQGVLTPAMRDKINPDRSTQ